MVVCLIMLWEYQKMVMMITAPAPAQDDLFSQPPPSGTIVTETTPVPTPTPTPPAVLNHPYLHPTHYHNLQQQHSLLRKEEENGYLEMQPMNNNGDHRHTYY
mmetsp:Transcript_32206/g.34666  ORF Transcript_32206/g.34666 Transcript_32206/m.34666 type:complete len:102 (+) Transcript_32206:588-893(+)